jgi:acetyl-CoA C-acetyltransferase
MRRASRAGGRTLASVIDDRLPVIVSTGQVLERDEIVGPLELMARAADLAFVEAPLLRDRVQHVSVVNPFSDAGTMPASELSEQLGLKPDRAETTTAGGNTPQWLVSRLAEEIWSGRLDVGLVAGGEAQRSTRAGRRNQSGGDQSGGDQRGGEQSGANRKRSGFPRFSASSPAGTSDRVVGDERLGFGDAEAAAGLLAPVHVYPLFESVIAHRAGRSFAEQREFLGKLLAPFTEVASRNPCAWFPEVRTPAEISEPSDDNRLVSEPYLKRMCAFLGVDQAAAVIICSYGAAKAAGVADSSIFCWSGADAEEVWFPTARPDLGALPGLRSAGNAALRAATLSIDEIGLLDFYSCFPCVVEMACDAFGLSLDDPRGLSVTGGLPYFGGPGNSYSLHAIATIVERLRSGGPSGAAGTGLVNGMGWYATKHSVGVYSTSPSANGWRRGDTGADQAQIDASAMPMVLDVPEPGEIATVAASTVHLDASGQVTEAPLIATLKDGRRLAARASESVLLAELRGRNLVGERVLVSGSPIRYQLT